MSLNLVLPLGSANCSGTTAYDTRNGFSNGFSTGHNIQTNATAQAAPSFVADQRGIANNALSFDGASQYLSLGQLYDVGVSDFTLMLWIKKTGGAGSTVTLLSHGAASGSNVGYLIELVSNTTPTLYLCDGSGSRIAIPLGTIEADTWAHVAFSIDRSGNCTPYLNKVAGTPVAVSSQQLTLAVAVDLLIGAGAGGATKLTGAMALVRYYDTALSASEIGAVYDWEVESPSVELGGSLTFSGGLSRVLALDRDLSGELTFNGMLVAGDGKWGLIVDDLDWQGSYDTLLGYDPGQSVIHAGSKTSSYKAIDTVPVATPPPNSDYWTRVVKGPWVLAGRTRDNRFSIEAADILHGHTYEVAVASRKVSGEEQEVESSPRAQIELSGKVSTPGAPSGLAVAAGLKSLILTWTIPTDVDWDFVEVWRSNTNDRAAAAKITTIRGTGYVDQVGSVGTTRYYWIRGADTSGNYSAWQPVGATSGVSGTTTGIEATDIADFAITASKLWTNIPILAGDAWANNDPGAGNIAWNEHTLYYGGNAFTIAASSTAMKYVYWVYPATSYSKSNTNPALSDNDFIIATNISGAHDLAWNAIANQVIGSAYIQDLAVIDAKINTLSADKLTAGTIDASVITVTNLDASNISTGTLTGLVVQTAASGQRIKIDSADNTMKFYDTSGTQVIIIDDTANGYLNVGVAGSNVWIGDGLIAMATAAGYSINIASQQSTGAIVTVQGNPTGLVTENILNVKGNAVDIGGNYAVDLNVLTGDLKLAVNTKALYIGNNKVVGARVVDARIDDAINTSTWDSTTAGVLDALRDAAITHGWIAAS